MSNETLDRKSTFNDLIPADESNCITNGTHCRWNSIDWPRAYRRVKKLRSRIFKATRRGDAKTVKRLQRLVVRSYENRLLAVKQLSQICAGQETPGLGLSMVSTPTERGELVDLLGNIPISTWKPTIARRGYTLLTNVNTSPQATGDRSVIDRCLQHVVKNALEPEWEAQFEDSSYGFRPGRSWHDALHRIYTNCQDAEAEEMWIVAANISGGTSDAFHQHVLRGLENFPERGIIERWLKSGHVVTLFNARQGDALSPLLVNIALHGMHKPLEIAINRRSVLEETEHLLGEPIAKRETERLLFVRYAGNLVVFCKSETAAKEASVKLNRWLSIRGFSLSKERTQIARIDQGFDFLAMTIRRFHISYANRNRSPNKRTRLLIQPSKRSILKCRSKLKRLWGKGQGNSVNLTIRRLNAFIRGWANSFRPYVSKEVLSSLDNYMFTQAVRFSRRTHPLKSWQWRKKRYFGKFHLARKDNWVFGEKRTGDFVLRFSWFPIQRHTMVRSDSSPYDPKYWDRNQSKRASCNRLQQSPPVSSKKAKKRQRILFL